MNKNALQAALQAASQSEKIELLRIAEELEKRERREEAQNDFLAFVRTQWPEFISGAHHRRIAKLFEDIAAGRKKRIIINLAPRHTKSEFASYLFPAWFLGKNPKKKVMQVSNTAELAEGFGRKVRNLLDTEEYHSIFPEVELRADSKAAGRWNTNFGGDYYACIAEEFVLSTSKGPKPAKTVALGDYLRTIGGWERVEQIHNSTHTEIIEIAGTCAFSPNHPIWTMNRGWVNAEEIISSDVLATETIFDKLRVALLKIGGAQDDCNLEHPPLSSLVQHEVSLRESKKREISSLWSAGHLCLRPLAVVLQFLQRHGRPTNAEAYYRQDRCEWAIYPSELQMGDLCRASKQQTNEHSYSREDNGRTCQSLEYNSRNHPFSGSTRYDPRRGYRGTEAEKEELWTYSDPKNIGWGRCKAFSLLTRCRKIYERITGHKKSYISASSRFGRAARHVQGILLGVRTVGDVRRLPRENQEFINFTLSGSNTFTVGGILTHNCGVGSALAGRGADIVIIDDPHSEAEALQAQVNPGIYDKVYEWYTTGPRQRLQPGGAIIIVQTRWSLRDLTGQIIETSQQKSGTDQWEVFEFPAILESGRPLWPEFWSLEALEATRAELPVHKWQAQYQQNPTSDENALIKRSDWQMWEKDDPPPVDYVIMAMDTAFEAKQSADYSAAVIFGVWTNPEDNNQPNLVLLNAWRGKLEFPELKAKTKELYKEWEPDSVIIEKKASGAPLITELRRSGIPAQEYTPSRGNDKIARLNAIVDIFASGKVWAPRKRWAEELIDEVASFPAGRYDDYVDCCSLALNRFRAGGFIGTQNDIIDEEADKWWYKSRKAAYY